MRRRSLAATLTLAFGVTTLAVFVLAGSFLYLALGKQIQAQDDLDIVLAPIQIGGVEVKNRIARTAHRTLYALVKLLEEQSLIMSTHTR